MVTELGNYGLSIELIKDTTTGNFTKDVIEESKRQPVLVDFWAPWCGPCKLLSPILEKTVIAAKGKVKLVRMNIDEHPAIFGQMGFESIPTVIAFVNGVPADGFMGALPERQISAFVRRLTEERMNTSRTSDMDPTNPVSVSGDRTGPERTTVGAESQDTTEDMALIGTLLDDARQRLTVMRDELANLYSKISSGN